MGKCKRCCYPRPQCNGGETGATGETGPMGPRGLSPPGETGEKGDPGRPGSLFYTGSGPPVVYPTSGVGHLYVDVNNGDIYGYGPSGWFPVGNIKGHTGATGATGATGETGPRGDTGATGASSGTNFGMAGYTFRTNAFATNVVSPLSPFNGSGFLNGTVTTFTPPQVSNANITISWNVTITNFVPVTIDLLTFISVNGNNPYNLSVISSTIQHTNNNIVLTDVIYIENLRPDNIYSVIPRWRASLNNSLGMIVGNLNHFTIQIEYFD